jgi:hypothetical protein
MPFAGQPHGRPCSTHPPTHPQPQHPPRSAGARGSSLPLRDAAAPLGEPGTQGPPSASAPVPTAPAPSSPGAPSAPLLQSSDAASWRSSDAASWRLSGVEFSSASVASGRNAESAPKPRAGAARRTTGEVTPGPGPAATSRGGGCAACGDSVCGCACGDSGSAAGVGGCAGAPPLAPHARLARGRGGCASGCSRASRAT